MKTEPKTRSRTPKVGRATNLFDLCEFDQMQQPRKVVHPRTEEGKGEGPLHVELYSYRNN